MLGPRPVNITVNYYIREMYSLPETVINLMAPVMYLQCPFDKRINFLINKVGLRHVSRLQ